MSGELPYFRSEIQEASRELTQLTEIKAKLQQDVAAVTAEQVRLLGESVGRVRQLWGLYHHYTFIGSPARYGYLRPGEDSSTHLMPPDRYRLLEVLDEPAQALLAVLTPEPNQTGIVYTAYADSLREALDEQLMDPALPPHPRYPDGPEPF